MADADEIVGGGDHRDMLGRLTTVALAVLVLGVVAHTGSVPGLDGGCAVPSASAADTGGCCHYNGGVCGCENRRTRCCDGKLSASCRCSGQATRQLRVDAQPLVSLADFAFAAQETPEPPSPRLNLFRLEADPLWFWFRVACGEECWSALAVDGALPLEVRWLFDPGGGPTLEGPPQAVTLQRNRPTMFVARPPAQLRQGRWETEVRFDTERLCTRPDGKCWFRIEVRR